MRITMVDDGVIKFNCICLDASTVDEVELGVLNTMRQRMYAECLIGEYANGIGYGNISLRLGGSRQFLISGTQTGNIESLEAKHYAKVIDFDLQKNSLQYYGGTQPSSEALTHAMVYDLNHDIKAIIHTHHHEQWKRLMHVIPTTGADIAYGTVAMALEMKCLYKEGDLKKERAVVMQGHEDGILFFGNSIDEAYEVLQSHFCV